MTNKKITWLAKYDDYSSMGILSQRLLESMNKKGYELSCKPIIGKTETANPLIHTLLNNARCDLGIMFAYPDMVNTLSEFKTKVIYTGVDTTSEAGNFVENSNKADFLITPSKLSKQRIEAMGVKKPVFVLPHGIDPNVFKYTERTKSDVFKFLYVGEASDRKGIFHLLKAFISLFENNDKVELHIKSNTDMLFYNSNEVQNIIKNHKNIHWHIGNEGHDKVIELYKKCHAYVYPSRGDSFGMTLLEAMACGLPIITTTLPGATDLLGDRVEYINSKLVTVLGHPWFKGEWGEPDLEELKTKMKQLYENYDTSKLKDHSDYIRETYSWDCIVDIFEREILPSLGKPIKVLTLINSLNAPDNLKITLDSLSSITEHGISNYVYIVENSDVEFKEDCLNVIYNNLNNCTVYDSKFNLGQRGTVLQMLEDVNLDEFDYVQICNQYTKFHEPLSTYINLLKQSKYTYIVTGYMSKEHTEFGWDKTEYGNVCRKRSCRSGHMIFRAAEFKSMMPIPLDRHYFLVEVNSVWDEGLDWELTYWNANSPGNLGHTEFVLCLPGGAECTDPNSNFEYTYKELLKMR